MAAFLFFVWYEGKELFFPLLGVVPIYAQLFFMGLIYVVFFLFWFLDQNKLIMICLY
jgi:hypothetical protein